MRKSKTLYVSDLDGTLLNDNSIISPESGQILRELTDKGLQFTFATARSYSTSKNIIRELTSDIPAIIYNGCAIVSSSTGELIYSVSFSGKEKEHIVSKLLKNHISPLVYSYIDGIEKVSYDKDSVTDGMQLYLDSRSGDSRINPTGKENIFLGDVFYFTIIDEKDKLTPVYMDLQESGMFNITFQCDKFFNNWWLEIMPKSASKANAILKLKDILGCNKIVSFGDAVNDIPMFKISDSCYAVEDSVDELKLMATEVIGSNNDDAVVRKIRQLFLEDSCQ